MRETPHEFYQHQASVEGVRQPCGTRKYFTGYCTGRVCQHCWRIRLRQDHGKRWPREPDADRGVVFQRYSVFPHLTAIQNVVLGLEFRDAKWATRLLGRKKNAAMEQAQTMLEAVGLGNNSHKYPHQLSGGMQQRLALAQSLIREPEILLLDEPFGALDPGIKADMHALLISLWQEKQFSVFMVTHDIQEGFALGTRLLVFDRVRNDPHEPDAYGAKIAYDIPLKQRRKWNAA